MLSILGRCADANQYCQEHTDNAPADTQIPQDVMHRKVSKNNELHR